MWRGRIQRVRATEGVVWWNAVAGQHAVSLEPGQMLLYESAKCLHGRSIPLHGRYYGSLFLHCECVCSSRMIQCAASPGLRCSVQSSLPGAHLHSTPLPHTLHPLLCRYARGRMALLTAARQLRHPCCRYPLFVWGARGGNPASCPACLRVRCVAEHD